MRNFGRTTTAATFAGIGLLHNAWGVGSTFPFADAATLADAVIGTGTVPPPIACHAVAGMLFTASALVLDLPIAPTRMRHIGRRVVVGVLAVRGIAGFMGQTVRLSPGSDSARFQRLDRRYFSPLCLLLALGTATSTCQRAR